MEKLNSGDIARLAGVSRATVSRVVNGGSGVKPETRRRVLELVRRYGYQPNWFGQALSRRRANTLGLFISLPEEFWSPSQGDYPGRAESNHLCRVMAQVAITARRNDFTALMIPEPNPVGVEESIREMFVQGRVDGGIFFGFPSDYALLEELAEQRYPVGLFDYDVTGRERANRIVVNLDGDIAGRAVRYLAGLGHRRIISVEGDAQRFSGAERAASFRHAMAELDLPDNLPHLNGGYTRQTGFRAVDAFLSSRPAELPTAYCCANDCVAYGVTEALRAHGIDVPARASVIGMDDLLLCQFCEPKLTTLALDFPAMMNTLTQRLIDYIREPFEEPFLRVYSAELVERGSCRRIKE